MAHAKEFTQTVHEPVQAYAAAQLSAAIHVCPIVSCRYARRAGVMQFTDPLST